MPTKTKSRPRRKARPRRYPGDNFVPAPATNQENLVQLPKTQAARIFVKFGGVPALARALEDAGCPRNLSTIYRWNLPRESNGSGGVIPTRAMRHVGLAALREGILLTPEDLYPFPDTD